MQSLRSIELIERPQVYLFYDTRRDFLVNELTLNKLRKLTLNKLRELTVLGTTRKVQRCYAKLTDLRKLRFLQSMHKVHRGSSNKLEVLVKLRTKCTRAKVLSKTCTLISKKLTFIYALDVSKF